MPKDKKKKKGFGQAFVDALTGSGSRRAKAGSKKKKNKVEWMDQDRIDKTREGFRNR